MEIEWLDSEQPSTVVGTAPDGGLFVHASLHPFGAAVALVRAKQVGVRGRQRAGETYFPMPWIRSELASVVKHRSAHGGLVAQTCRTLFVILPALQGRVESTRTAGRLEAGEKQKRPSDSPRTAHDRGSGSGSSYRALGSKQGIIAEKQPQRQNVDELEQSVTMQTLKFGRG